MKDEEENLIPEDDFQDKSNETNDEATEEGFDEIVSIGNHFYENDETQKIRSLKLQECTRIGFWIMLRM